MNHLVVGYGEIGKAVGAVLGNHDWTDLEEHSGLQKNYETLHICIPYSKEFSKQVRDYIDIYSPAHVAIYSTVPIGTTEEISLKIIHSPVEGKHPDLEMSIRQMERWIGYNEEQEQYYFVELFQSLGLRVRTVPKTSWTEALKLLSTTEYGVNLLFADYKARIAEALGMDFELTKDWNREYNKLYRNLGMEKRFQKFVLDAPGGHIGGHCVVPNAKLLNEQYPDELVQKIGEME